MENLDVSSLYITQQINAPDKPGIITLRNGMKMINKKALFWALIMMGISLIFSFKVALAEELSFIKDNPTLKAKLLAWEKESSETQKAQIKSLRQDDAIGKAYAAIAIRQYPKNSQGAILALIETLKDFSGLQWGPGYTSDATSPAAEAWTTLGKIGKPAIEPLVAALKDRDDDIRHGAARALGEIGSPEAVEALIKTLHDSSDQVRIGVVNALGSINDSRAVEPLISALTDEREGVREEAVIALGKFKGPRVTEGLIVALIDKENRVQREAIKILGPQKTFELVIPFMKDKNSKIRRAAVEAMLDLKNPNAVKYLIVALKDENREVRTEAARVLGNLEDPRAVGPLIDALKDEDNNVSSSARSALRKIKDPRAVEAIIESIKDKNGTLQIGKSAIFYTAKKGDSFSQIANKLFGNPHLWAELRDMYNEQNRDNPITGTLFNDGHKLTFEIRGKLSQLLRPNIPRNSDPSKQLKP
jgi:HEAT repeat protein